MNGLDASGIIRVTSSILPSGLVRRETGRTLFLTERNEIPLQERVRVYSNINSLAEDFGSSTSVYRAAAKYFAQSPFPKPFHVGRWAKVADPTASVTGGTMTADLPALKAITNGGFKFKCSVVDSYGDVAVTERSITELDFSGAASLAAVATIIETKIETALGALISGATVVVSSTGCSISAESADPLVILAIDFLTAPASGVDLSLAANLNMRSTSGGVVRYSEVAETVEDALSAIAFVQPNFTFVCEDETITAVDADVEAISAWCESQRVFMFSAASFDAKVPAGTAGSAFANLRVIEPENTFGTYSATKDFKNVSAAARLSSVNFSAANSQITMNLKILKGCAPDIQLTETMAGKIVTNGANFYSTRSGLPAYENGQTFNRNWWIDTKYWMIWFENACLTAYFNLLYQSKKVPQTDTGMNAIVRALNAVCREGVRNGGIAAGQCGDALTLEIQQTIGSPDFSGFLQEGFLVYAEPVALQNSSDRNQRFATPVHIWLKGAGAIHYGEAAILFEQ